MSNPPKKAAKPVSKFSVFEKERMQESRFSNQRRQDMATRSTLRRLRNRKSDIK